MLKLTFDFKGISLKEGVDAVKAKVREEMAKTGEEAVAYAVENGTYRNITGRLRASNRYEVSEDKLTLINDAPYAADVEARGRDVLSGAHLFAVEQLKDKFER